DANTRPAKMFFIAKMLFILDRLSSHTEQVKRWCAFAAFPANRSNSPSALPEARRMPWIILGAHVSRHELPEPYPLILCHRLDTNSSDTTNEDSHTPGPCENVSGKGAG